MLFIVYTVNGNVTFGWDDTNSPRADSYEVCLIRDVTGEIFTYSTTNSTMAVRPPKSGKYEVTVRAVRGNEKSAACSSLDPQCAQLKDGTHGDWKAYWKPAGPGGPMVIY